MQAVLGGPWWAVSYPNPVSLPTTRPTYSLGASPASIDFPAGAVLTMSHAFPMVVNPWLLAQLSYCHR